MRGARPACSAPEGGRQGDIHGKGAGSLPFGARPKSSSSLHEFEPACSPKVIILERCAINYPQQTRPAVERLQQPVDDAGERLPSERVVEVSHGDVVRDLVLKRVRGDEFDLLARSVAAHAFNVACSDAVEIRRQLDPDYPLEGIARSLNEHPSFARAEVDEDVVTAHLGLREDAPEVEPARGLIPNAFLGLEPKLAEAHFSGRLDAQTAFDEVPAQPAPSPEIRRTDEHLGNATHGHEPTSVRRRHARPATAPSTART